MTDIVDRNGVRYEVGCRAERRWGAEPEKVSWIEVDYIDGGGLPHGRSQALGSMDARTFRSWEIVRLADGTDPRQKRVPGMIRLQPATLAALEELKAKTAIIEQRAWASGAGQIHEPMRSPQPRPVGELYAEFRETVARVVKREIPAIDLKKGLVTDFVLKSPKKSDPRWHSNSMLAWITFQGLTEEVCVPLEVPTAAEARTEEACHAIADRLSRKMLGNE